MSQSTTSHVFGDAQRAAQMRAVGPVGRGDHRDDQREDRPQQQVAEGHRVDQHLPDHDQQQGEKGMGQDLAQHRRPFSAAAQHGGDIAAGRVQLRRRGLDIAHDRAGQTAARRWRQHGARPRPSAMRPAGPGAGRVAGLHPRRAAGFQNTALPAWPKPRTATSEVASTTDQISQTASIPRTASRISSLPMKPDSGGRPAVAIAAPKNSAVISPCCAMRAPARARPCRGVRAPCRRPGTAAPRRGWNAACNRSPPPSSPH